MKKIIENKFLSSPKHFLFAVTVAVFFYELIIMIALKSFEEFIPQKLIPIIDTVLLSMLLLPVLYFFLYRPLKLTLEQFKEAQKNVKKANEELEKTNEELEARIEERSEQLNYMAYHDSLTGVANRRMLHLQLKKAITEASGNNNLVAVLFMDLDDLKQINDSYGHTLGDELIVSFTNRLKSLISPSDTLARWGGDEFALIIPNLPNIEKLEHFSKRIISAYKEPFQIQGEILYVTTSVGIAVYPSDGTDMEDIIKNADIAMYKAKELGGNNYHFYISSLNEKTMAKIKLTNDLRQALINNEFVIHYQPILNADNEQVIGAEALLRWNSPKNGMITPKEFIPLAEETGLIVPIGEWVIKEATRQFKQWQQAHGESLYLSVNLSSKQFIEPNLDETILKILKTNNFDPSLLRVEITEGIVVKDIEFTTKTLEKLASSGIKIAIDDFGTGYSSLTYLKRFPIDTIKIDRSFVSEMTTNNDDKEIVMATIALAKGLKLETIAEGVETQEQLIILMQKDCKLIQGFFFSAPLPALEFEVLLKNKKLQNNLGA